MRKVIGFSLAICFALGVAATARADEDPLCIVICRPGANLLVNAYSTDHVRIPPGHPCDASVVTSDETETLSDGFGSCSACLGWLLDNGWEFDDDIRSPIGLGILGVQYTLERDD